MPGPAQLLMLSLLKALHFTRHSPQKKDTYSTPADEKPEYKFKTKNIHVIYLA